MVVMETQYFVYPNGMSKRFEMVLTTQEKVFIVEPVSYTHLDVYKRQDKQNIEFP